MVEEANPFLLKYVSYYDKKIELHCLKQIMDFTDSYAYNQATYQHAMSQKEW